MRGHRTRKCKIVIFLVATVIASGTRLFADILYGGDVTRFLKPVTLPVGNTA